MEQTARFVNYVPGKGQIIIEIKSTLEDIPLRIDDSNPNEEPIYHYGTEHLLSDIWYLLQDVNDTVKMKLLKYMGLTSCDLITDYDDNVYPHNDDWSEFIS
jgi:hypothetical protein